jgi:hypothetical protein
MAKRCGQRTAALLTVLALLLPFGCDTPVGHESGRADVSYLHSSLLPTVAHDEAHLPPPAVGEHFAHVVVYFDVPRIELGEARHQLRAWLDQIPSVVQYRLNFRGFPATSIVLPISAIPTLRRLHFVRDVYVGSPDETAVRSGTDDWSWAAHALHWHYDSPGSNPSPATGEDVKIAVLDGGVQCSLSDIPCAAESGTVVGGDPQSSDPLDDQPHHGTFVASIAAAVHGNGTGIRGVAKLSDIISIKLFPMPPSSYVCALSAEAIEMANQLGTHVIITSYGTSCDPNDPLNPERNAVNTSLAVVVASAGNVSQTGSAITPPAKYSGSVAVGGARWDQQLDRVDWWNESPTGPEMNVIAGAASVIGVFPDGSVQTRSGTSYAAPRVAGAIAVVLSRAFRDNDGCGNPHEAKEVVLRNAYLPAWLAPDPSRYGSGILHVHDAASDPDFPNSECPIEG